MNNIVVLFWVLLLSINTGGKYDHDSGSAKFETPEACVAEVGQIENKVGEYITAKCQVRCEGHRYACELAKKHYDIYKKTRVFEWEWERFKGLSIKPKEIK